MLDHRMHPAKLTIHALFERERRFIVPLYQRPYVWNLEGQWQPLWEDIERAAETCIEAGFGDPKRAHFLGALVLNAVKITGSRVARSEIIDGQQRITTLQILLAALRDYADAVRSPTAMRVKDLTEHRHQKPGSEDLLKVWPTNADRAMFRGVMSAGSPEVLLSELGVGRSEAPRIAAAYLFFWDRIDEFCSADGSAEQRERRLEALYQAFRTALQVVVIELEDEDDPQIIFETLNARGQPLLPSDLIRNYIFQRAEGETGKDPEELYDRFWRSFDERRLSAASAGEDRFWHAEERQGRLVRPRIDLFLFHYLVMRTERDLPVGQLFREFRSWHAEKGLSVEALLADLNKHAGIFAKLIAPTGDDRVSAFAKRLKALDTSTVYPLLLYLLGLHSDRLPQDSRTRILQDLESWLVRRSVCLATAKNYNRFFVSLLAKVKAASPEQDLAALIREQLTLSDDPTTHWPTDEEFRRGWLDNPLYGRARPDRAVMILRVLELQERSGRNEAIILPRDLTVEHLLPQNGSLENYPYAAEMPARENETDELCRKRLIHTVGNLTLLTGPLNASVSNGPFPRKVENIRRDSDLRLNAWLRANPPSSWSEADILNRGATLFNLALELWPRPAAARESETIGSAASRTGPVKDRQALERKREAIVAALARRESQPLVAETRAKYRDPTGSLRAVVAISKRYGGSFDYWLTHHPEWQNYLEGAAEGFLVLGCLDRDECFAIPAATMRSWLDALSATKGSDRKRPHWHIHLVAGERSLQWILPGGAAPVDLTPFRIPLASACTEPPVLRSAE